MWVQKKTAFDERPATFLDRYDGVQYENRDTRAHGGSATAEMPTYPKYEAEYLKNALMHGEKSKYDSSGLGHAPANVYLQHVTRDYKDEAQEAMRQEFSLWLQGLHTDNVAPSVYENGPGKVTRRWTTRDSNRPVGAIRDGWRPTPWGQAQLTHLPGVRSFLRSQAEKAVHKEVKLNLLADHGPQDLESAWQYFVTFVKGRPVSDAIPIVTPGADNGDPRNKARFNQMPDNMRHADTWQYDDPEPPVRAPLPSPVTVPEPASDSDAEREEPEPALPQPALPAPVVREPEPLPLRMRPVPKTQDAESSTENVTRDAATEPEATTYEDVGTATETENTFDEAAVQAFRDVKEEFFGPESSSESSNLPRRSTRVRVPKVIWDPDSAADFLRRQ